MPFNATIGTRLSWAATIASHDENGSLVQLHGRPPGVQPQLSTTGASSELFALATDTPSDSIRRSGGGRGASLSGVTGRSGEAKRTQRKQEVRQMSQRTPHLPLMVEPSGSRIRVQMNDIVSQLDSVDVGHPTGRLARSGSEVAA